MYHRNNPVIRPRIGIYNIFDFQEFTFYQKSQILRLSKTPQISPKCWVHNTVRIL